MAECNVLVAYSVIGLIGVIGRVYTTPLYGADSGVYREECIKDGRSFREKESGHVCIQ